MTDQPTHTNLYQETLHTLIGMGTNLARQIESHPNPIEAATAFEKVARSIRRTIALAQSLNKPTRRLNRTAARKKIIRGVEDNIGFELEAQDRAPYREELLDRLDTEEFEFDLDNYPINQIIKEICDDLGVPGISGPKPWKRRTIQDIKTIHARATAQTGQIHSPSPARGRGSG